MMAGAIFGWFRQRSLWRRTCLFLLSVPLALGANMVRIVILVGSSILFGQKFAIGEHDTSTFHLFTGIFVFLVAFTGLRIAENALNRWCRKEKPLQLIED